MDAFLEEQLTKGKKLAEALVEHLESMGAAQCLIPVGDYIVVVSMADLEKGDAAWCKGSTDISCASPARPDPRAVCS
jgi:hypothetical protein